MRKQPIYLLEKATGIVDENGVKLFYAFAARLTRAAAERDFEHDIETGAVRIKKLLASK